MNKELKQMLHDYKDCKPINFDELVYQFEQEHNINEDVISVLEQQNKRYKNALKEILGIEYDEVFNGYEYMVIKAIDIAEKTLKNK